MSHPNDTKELEVVDPNIYKLIIQEQIRQEEGLELIASENYTSKAVMEAQGSCLTNKYAEGYPQKRYYGGCEHIDKIEQLAIDRAKKLFKAESANVQPHSGSGANMASYFSLVNPGETIMGMNLSEGGHLTHGSPVNFSGKLFNVTSYGVNNETELIDYDQLEVQAKKSRPKLIIAGASAYPRFIDFEKIGNIAKEVDAYFLVDMAHIAGLVATGLHPCPIEAADVVTSTTHKTLRGPRGGLILSKEKFAKKINSNIFPGIQGGPLEHVIAAKAVCFHEALLPNFKKYQELVLSNAKVLASSLRDLGVELVTGGTDNHLVLLKTDSLEVSGKEAEEALTKANITVNKNMIPGDTRSPFVTSGIRIGTAAVTTRGLGNKHMEMISDWIVSAIKNKDNDSYLSDLAKKVKSLCHDFPVY